LETQLLKQILQIEFYDKYKDKLSRTLFEDELLELYDVIVEAHGKYGADISTEELTQLWLDKYPVTTNATKRSMLNTIEAIKDETLINPDIAGDLLKNLWTRDFGRKIAEYGLNMAQGKEGAFEGVRRLIELNGAGVMPDDFGDDTTQDLDTLLELTSDANRFQFNIRALNKVCAGIGRTEFAILFARPETGKTALSISLPFGPGGFAEQGLRIAYLGNEEATERTMLRAYSCWTGMTKAEIILSPELATERFQQIKDKVFIRSIMGWNINKVEAYIKHVEADVVFIDQADKVTIEGTYERPDLKLRELYTQLRELPKRQNCALFGVSQASNDAENKTVVTPDMMENSKTGKYAEADLIIGVGKYADNEDGTDDPIRFLTIGKNKISGYHGTIPVKLEKAISRYVD
jgi:replicative DNA helicase